MRVDLDAKLISRDDHEVGSIERAIVDPTTKEVVEFVINTGGLFGRDLLLPRAEIEQATQDGDRLQLRLTRDELEQLPSYVAANFMPPPAGWAAPVGDPFLMGGNLWPVMYPTTDANNHEPTLAKGDVVLERDGHEIGVVDDVAFDAATGRLTGFVLRVGNAFTTFFGGGETVSIDRDKVDRVEEARVYLNVGRDALRR